MTPEPMPFPFEVLAEGVASIAPDGTLAAQNEAMRSLLVAAGAATRWAELPFDADVRALLAHGDPVVAPVVGRSWQWRLCEHGGRRWLLARDVGERDRAETSEWAAARLRLLGRLAGSIVHDFNNLLGSAMGLASLLVTGTTDAGERRLLEELQSGSQRSATLARALARLLRTEPRQWQSVAVGDVVDEALAVVRRIAAMQSAAIETAIDADLPRIRVLTDEVLQMLLHGMVAAMGRRPACMRVTATRERHRLGSGRDRACVAVHVVAEGCAPSGSAVTPPDDDWQPQAALAMARMGGQLAHSATVDRLAVDYVWPALPSA